MEIIKLDVEDERYPQRLLKIKNFPTEIYAVGDIKLLNSEFTVGIVGSRKCTEYGRRVANEFAREISQREICVISGMAIGIDGIAHNAAIEEKGKTIAVLGGGLNYIYPPENEWLFHKILEKGGCVISEFSPDTEPDTKKFPDRNRIISGLSDALLVVEATYRSGSSITAKYARSEGKVVYAVPNNIYTTTGVGTNRLIRKGAILVTEPVQIIEHIKGDKKDNRKENKTKSSKSKQKRETIEEIKKEVKKIPKEYLEIYRILSNEPIHINEIARKLNKTIQEINQTITIMEIMGYVEQPQICYFKRRTEGHP